MTRPLTVEEKFAKTQSRILASEEDMPGDHPVAYFMVMLLEAVNERMAIDPFMEVKRNV